MENSMHSNNSVFTQVLLTDGQERKLSAIMAILLTGLMSNPYGRKTFLIVGLYGRKTE